MPFGKFSFFRNRDESSVQQSPAVESANAVVSQPSPVAIVEPLTRSRSDRRVADGRVHPVVPVEDIEDSNNGRLVPPASEPRTSSHIRQSFPSRTSRRSNNPPEQNQETSRDENRSSSSSSSHHHHHHHHHHRHGHSRSQSSTRASSAHGHRSHVHGLRDQDVAQVGFDQRMLLALAVVQSPDSDVRHINVERVRQLQELMHQTGTPPRLQDFVASLESSRRRPRSANQQASDLAKAQQEAEHRIFMRNLSRLPKHKFSPGTSQSAESMECAICCCEYEAGDELRTLSCFHIFHSPCVDKWLAIKKMCPVCKINPFSRSILHPSSSSLSEA